MSAAVDADEPEKALILTYHSHHVVGDDYGHNDHIAFVEDLELLTAVGFLIVPLGKLVDTIRGNASDVRSRRRRPPLVALTFDDGPIYDVEDFVHPEFGRQRSFLNVMRDFRATRGATTQPGLHATSFVIASPDARRVIEDTFDREYTYLRPRSMDDDWWLPAIETGLVDIANHSWDHLHPALPQVAHSRQVRADFRQVLTPEDADAQIYAAAAFIAAKTKGKAEPFFAYPFGHYNDFLVRDYFPSRGGQSVRAAFSVDPRAIAATDSMWCVPRYVCGDDWRTRADLERILAQ
jgi:peptidoglycan/xylan/chitin deacetylase (PgdA/CDA1 family)